MADDPGQRGTSPEGDDPPDGPLPGGPPPPWGTASPPWAPGHRPAGMPEAYPAGPYVPGPYAHGAYGQGAYRPGPYGPPQGDYGPPGAAGRYAWPYVPPPPPRAPLSAEERRRRGLRLLVFALVLVVALGGGIGIGAAVAPTSPTAEATSLLHESMSAAVSAGSYRYVELSTVLGSPDDIAGLALAQGGSQVIRQRCKSGTNTFDLRLVRGVVFFKGNPAAVADQLGVPSTRAGTLAGRWVRVTKGEKPYISFADGITTRSNISQLPTVLVPSSTKPVAGSSPPETAIVGALYAGKHRAPVGTASLDVITSSSLPKSLRGSHVTTSGRYEVSWTFSHFGTHRSMKSPPGALAYASLHASPPSKSTCV